MKQPSLCLIHAFVLKVKLYWPTYSEHTEYSQQSDQNEYDGQDFEFSLQREQSQQSRQSLEREYNQQSQDILQSQQDDNEEMDFLAGLWHWLKRSYTNTKRNIFIFFLTF